jgi:uncharacterized protein (DUF1015 family)
VIADGHHRYHTALTYQAERRPAPGHRRRGRERPPGGYDSIMAFVVELSEDQLSVGPIHRTLSGLPAGLDLAETFGQWFDTVHVGPADETLVDAVADSEALALITAGDVWLLTPREETYTEAGSDLDSSLIALVVEQIPGVPTTYHHDWHSAIAAVDGRRGRRRRPHPARDRGPDRRMGPRPPADAAQEHLLPSQAADGDGLPTGGLRT